MPQASTLPVLSVDVLPYPAQLTLYVALPCNLRCENCYLFGVADYDRDYMRGGKERRYMSMEVLEAAIAPLAASPRPTSICLMGGEPLLHPRLDEMIRFIRRTIDGYIDMNTNGMLLPRVGQQIADAGIDAIYVSLDGSCPDTNDASRGSGSFAAALAGIRTMQRYRREHGRPTAIAINHTVTRHNFHELVEMVELATREELDEVFFNLPTFVRRHEGEAARDALARDLGLTFESWRGFVIDSVIDDIEPGVLTTQLEQLQSWRDRRGGPKVFVQPIGYAPRELATYFDDRWDATLRERACPIQGFRTSVLPSGDVIPCTVYPDLVLGNVREQSLPEVWRGDAYARFRRYVSERLLPTCKRCCDLFDETQGDPFAFVTGSREAHQL
jgi:MoaA/NifB/PqqE/SkfB family radical SAM enzyme